MLPLLMVFFSCAVSSAVALTVEFPSPPVVGADFKVTLDSPFAVGCENDIAQQSMVFKGMGKRTVNLGKIQGVGFYRLTFAEAGGAGQQVVVVAALAAGAGEVLKSTASPSTLDKFMAQLTKANAQRWFGTWDKAKALSEKAAGIAATGTLVTACVAARPLFCREAALTAGDVLADLLIAYTEHIVAEMVKEKLLTAAEGQEMQKVIKAGKLVKTMTGAALGDLTERVLAVAEAIAIKLDDPTVTLTVGLQKDAASKANKLILELRKLP